MRIIALLFKAEIPFAGEILTWACISGNAFEASRATALARFKASALSAADKAREETDPVITIESGVLEVCISDISLCRVWLEMNEELPAKRTLKSIVF